MSRKNRITMLDCMYDGGIREKYFRSIKKTDRVYHVRGLPIQTMPRIYGAPCDILRASETSARKARMLDIQFPLELVVATPEEIDSVLNGRELEAIHVHDG